MNDKRVGLCGVCSSRMQFEWDDAKNEANQRKHGISSQLAVRIFEDPFYVAYKDRIVDGEERFRAIGAVDQRLLLLVVHTVVHTNSFEETIRIISARELTLRRGGTMKTRMVRYTSDTLPAITADDLKVLSLAEPRPDSEIDTSDIPELTDDERASRPKYRGRLFRPGARKVHAVVDNAVAIWLVEQGEEANARVNEVLRREMLSATEQRRKATSVSRDKPAVAA